MFKADRCREGILGLESGIAKLLIGQNLAMNNAVAEREHVHSLISSLQRDIQKITPSVAPSIGASLVPSIIQSLETTVSSALKKGINECISKADLADKLQKLIYNQHHRQTKHTAVEGNNDTFSKSRRGPEADEGRLLKTKQQRYIFRKHCQTPVGQVILSCDRYTHILFQSQTGINLYDEHCVFRFRFSFISSSWLSRSASFVTGTWDPFSGCTLTTLALRFRPVVDSHSPVVKACENGDIKTIKHLFDMKQASPFDITPGGYGLPHVSILEPTNVNKCLHLCQVAVCSLSATRYETCEFLINVGCREMGPTASGLTPNCYSARHLY